MNKILYLKRYLVYNAITAPIIYLLYLPYYVLYLKLSIHQLVLAATATIPLALLTNIVITWMVTKVVYWEDKIFGRLE